MQRAEHDFIGTKMIPEDALYGIHAVRAHENFPYLDPFDIDWYACVGTVKLACYKTYLQLHDAITAKYSDKPPIPLIDKTVLNALILSRRGSFTTNSFWMVYHPVNPRWSRHEHQYEHQRDYCQSCLANHRQPAPEIIRKLIRLNMQTSTSQRTT